LQVLAPESFFDLPRSVVEQDHPTASDSLTRLHIAEVRRGVHAAVVLVRVLANSDTFIPGDTDRPGSLPGFRNDQSAGRTNFTAAPEEFICLDVGHLKPVRVDIILGANTR